MIDGSLVACYISNRIAGVMSGGVGLGQKQHEQSSRKNHARRSIKPGNNRISMSFYVTASVIEFVGVLFAGDLGKLLKLPVTSVCLSLVAAMLATIALAIWNRPTEQESDTSPLLAQNAIYTSLHSIPSPPSDFTGRGSELDELQSKLENEGVIISGMHGSGGIGKSALAYKLAERLALRYPDAQIYVDLKGTSKQPMAVAEAMGHVIRAWDVNASIPVNGTTLQALYRSILHDKKTLLLFDNASDEKQIEPLIPPNSCLMLVTSRNRFTLPGCYSKNLEKMEPEDARALIMKIDPRLSKAEAEKLAKICAYLPQALRTAAGSLASSPNLSPIQFLTLLEDRKNRLGHIEGTFDVSYELMEDRMQIFWRLLGVFPGAFDGAGAAAVWETDKSEAQNLLTWFCKRSMLDWDDKTNHYKLHDPAKDFALSKLSEQELEAASFRHAAYYAIVSETANSALLQGGESCLLGLGIYDQERDNIETGWKWAQERCENRDDAAKLCTDYALKSALILGLRLRPAECIDWMDTALRSARQIKDRQSEGNALDNLGIYYLSQGDYKRAIEFSEQALKIAGESGDRMGEGKALGNLGNAFAEKSDYQQAIELGEQSLAIFREIGNRRHESVVLGNLGSNYLLLGDYERAIELYEQRLVIAKEIGDRMGEGSALGNLGTTYCSLGKYEHAIKLYAQQLKIAKEIGNRKHESIVSGNLGSTFFHLGNYKRAIELYEQQLKIARETVDRNGEANALFNNSHALMKLDRREEALVAAKAALEIYVQLNAQEVEMARELVAKIEGSS